jgi:hypothetical protein
MTERLALIRTPRALWRRLYFVRHLVEMVISMNVGMFLGMFLFALALGTSVDAARREHPLAHLLVMAFAMTVPMVAWMLYRGHSGRIAGEMAAAMIAPALPLAALDAANVVSGSVSGAYMNASLVVMIALIVYRRSEYRMAAAAQA